MSGPADSKSVPGFNNCHRFVGEIEQNEISNSYENYCTFKLLLKWRKIGYKR